MTSYMTGGNTGPGQNKLFNLRAGSVMEEGTTASNSNFHQANSMVGSIMNGQIGHYSKSQRTHSKQGRMFHIELGQNVFLMLISSLFIDRPI